MTRPAAVKGGTVVSVSPSFASVSDEPLRLLQDAGLQVRLVGAEEVAAPEDLAAAITDAAAVIVGTQEIDDRALDSADGLRCVAKHGTGVDNIDLAAARRRDITVVYAPGRNATAVAELTMGLLIALARDIVPQDRNVRAGTWAPRIGRALTGSVLGLVGAGMIGEMVARRAQAFGMRILAYDPAVDPAKFDVPLVDFDSLLSGSDFVSLHVPLNDETRGLLGARAFSVMNASAYVINTSRGGIVDEQALVSALEEGAIAGAALDVFEVEPPTGSALLASDRVVLSPHTAGYTDVAVEEVSRLTAEQIITVLAGGTPAHAVGVPSNPR